jgi:hypothetical protein
MKQAVVVSTAAVPGLQGAHCWVLTATLQPEGQTSMKQCRHFGCREPSNKGPLSECWSFFEDQGFIRSDRRTAENRVYSRAGKFNNADHRYLPVISVAELNTWRASGPPLLF